MHKVTLLLGILGTYVFGLSGGMLAVKRGFDLFGISVLSVVTAVAGGILRDLLLGSTPPEAITSPISLAVSLLAAVSVFFFQERVGKESRPILLLDALGLAIFAATGARKSLQCGIGSEISVVLGMLSGVGGGIIRDLLAAEAPVILKADLYATAAFTCAGIVVLGTNLKLPPLPVLGLALLMCFLLRLGAIYLGWHLPFSRGENQKAITRSGPRFPSGF